MPSGSVTFWCLLFWLFGLFVCLFVCRSNNATSHKSHLTTTNSSSSHLTHNSRTGLHCYFQCLPHMTYISWYLLERVSVRNIHLFNRKWGPSLHNESRKPQPTSQNTTKDWSKNEKTNKQTNKKRRFPKKVTTKTASFISLFVSRPLSAKAALSLYYTTRILCKGPCKSHSMQGTM